MSRRTLVSVTRLAPLVCHPSTPPGGVTAIAAGARVTRDGLLACSFRVDGALEHLRIPPPGVPRMGSRLWQHTCFEAFVAAGSGPAYQEFNFAPSGEWAAFAFRGYRDGEALTDAALAPQITVRRGATWLELDASVQLLQPSPSDVHAPLRLSLTAVIETQDGALSYWALCHPPGAPDFHHPDTFALTSEGRC